MPKTYRARVGRRRRSASGALRALREGVELDDGPTAPATVRLLAPGELELTIREGRNRQVRRMCEAVGHPVVRADPGRLRARCASAIWRPARTAASAREEIAGLGGGL